MVDTKGLVDKKARVKEYVCVACIGALGYSLLEILWRGHTHWSMTLTGGLCLPLIYQVHAARRPGLLGRSLICAGIVTTVEFLVGVTVNLLLGWHVWDYSEQRFNLLGQVCPLFSLLWCLLSMAIYPLCHALRRHFRHIA